MLAYDYPWPWNGQLIPGSAGHFPTPPPRLRFHQIAVAGIATWPEPLTFNRGNWFAAASIGCFCCGVQLFIYACIDISISQCKVCQAGPQAGPQVGQKAALASYATAKSMRTTDSQRWHSEDLAAWELSFGY